MIYRNVAEYAVIRINKSHPGSYMVWDGFKTFDEALGCWLEVKSRYLFNDVHIVQRIWSDHLNCYIGAQIYETD